MILGKPQGMTDEQCGSLPIFRDIEHNQMISCFELTQDEIEEIQKTGRIYLGVAGMNHPPVWLQVETPFIQLDSYEEGDA